MVTRVSAADRFWSKVNKYGPLPLHVPEIGQCWVWMAGRFSDGYGVFKVQGLMWRAPRYSWLLEHSEHPKHRFVLHHCDNRSCVRPSHLFLGNQQSNMADRQDKGRQPYGRRNGRAKLTDELVLKLRAAAKTGLSYAALGRAFGISSVMARLIVVRKNWVHV